MKGFGRDAARSIALAGLTSVLGLVSSVLVARLVGVDQLGRFAFIQSIVLIALIPVQLGLPDLIVREVAAAGHGADARPLRARTLLRWGSRLVFAFGAVAAAGLVAFFTLSSGMHGGTPVLLVLAPVLLFTPRMNIAASALRALGAPVAGQLPDKLVRPATIAVIVALLFDFLPEGPRPAEWVAFATLSGYVASWVVVELMLRRRIGRAMKAPFLDSAERKRYFAAAVALGAITAVQVVNTNIDFVALGLLSDNAETGVYRVATSLGTLGVAALLAINMVAAPRIAAARAAPELAVGLDWIVGQAALISVTISGTFALIVYTAGDPLIALLYGDDFLPAVAPLKILALGQLASSAVGPIALTLSMLGYERSVLVAMAVSLASKLVLVAILVPLFGATGTAVTSTISLLIWNIALWLRARKALGVDTSVLGGVRNMFVRHGF